MRSFLWSTTTYLSEKGEDIPFQMKRMFDATIDNKSEPSLHDRVKTDTLASESVLGDLGNRQSDNVWILHFAANSSIDWLLKICLRAGMDINAMDHHAWTTYAMAKAQANQDCMQILQEHAETHGMSLEVKGKPPSALRNASALDAVEFEEYGLRARILGYNNSDSSIIVYGDHPIPPTEHAFYFEVQILKGKEKSGTLFDMGIFNPTSIDGPARMKFAYGYTGTVTSDYNGTPLRLKDQHSWNHNGDVVGCGVDLQQGTIFLTKNGVSLGRCA